MSNFNPLLYSLLILFGLGIIFGLIGTSFNLETNGNGDLLDNLADNIDTGFDVTIPFSGSVNINPFNLLPTVIKDFIVSSVLALSYIPTLILIPLAIILFLAITFGVIKIVLP